MDRRDFIGGVIATGAMSCVGCAGLRSDNGLRGPVARYGVQAGDVQTDSAVVWSCADRDSLMHVEVSRSPDFRNVIKNVEVPVSDLSGFAGKARLTGLPRGQKMFYRIQFSDVHDHRLVSAPQVGRFQTAPDDCRSIRFAWSGDTAGQGWGIDVERGGMRTYATMLRHAPDFLIHSGDTIYADAPIAPAQAMPNGDVWHNLIAEGVDKVAESLTEFRGRHKYNLLDVNVRDFNANVPVLYQWDDHEVVDNWSPSTSLQDDERYSEKSVATLVSRSRRALQEMLPISVDPTQPDRLYRKASYGPLLDVFMLDLRSYRGANTGQRTATADTQILGREQLEWLASEAAESTATWKVIASSQPIGMLIWDDWRAETGIEGIADGRHGPPHGRENEVAELLSRFKRDGVRNLIWLCADVHYTAAHHYHPDRAVFNDFDPFWEFVSGPLHAGTFAQGPLDQTFGPEVVFAKAPTFEEGINQPPSEDMQFFGLIDIDGESGSMTVRLMDRGDTELYSIMLESMPGE